MANGSTANPTWENYAALHDALYNIKIGLELTIQACNLIAKWRKEGIRVEYFSGNPPESAVVVRCDDPPAYYSTVEHELRTAIDCMGRDWISAVWDHLPVARKLLDAVPAALQADLTDAADGRQWHIQVRRVLNEIAESPSPYRSFLTPPPAEARFPRNVSDAVYVCNHGPSRDGWSQQLEQLRKRLAELRACRPSQTKADNVGQQTGTGDGEIGVDQPPASSLALEALMGEEDGEILTIARSDRTVEERQRAIYGIDNRVLAWESGRWAKLLGCSDAAARKTDWWKLDRANAIEAAANAE